MPQWQLFLDTDLIAVSEPFSVYSTFHSLEGGYERGDTAYTHDQVDFGASYGPWSFAYIWRFDYYLNFHPDTAALAHRYENDLALDLNRSHTINAFWNHARSTGFKASYTFNSHDRLKLRLAASFLRADRMLHANARGVVLIDANEAFGGDVILDYRYTRDPLLHHDTDELVGNGYAVDAYVNWRASQRLTIAFSAEDWLNAIWWRDAPFTTVTMTSSTVNLDDHGFINTTPLLSGTEGYRNFRQKLPVRTSIGVSYRTTPQIEVIGQALNVGSLNLPVIGVRYHRAPDRCWSLTYGTVVRAITASFEGKWWHVSVGLDRFNLEKAHFVSMQAGVAVRW